jgi:predicted nuclease of predicted toxin-antitoxin system
LPLGNRPLDLAINELSITKDYVVVTKDSDFVESFVVRGEPWKVPLVSTGNIRNSDLETLFRSSIERIVNGFKNFDLIALSISDGLPRVTVLVE